MEIIVSNEASLINLCSYSAESQWWGYLYDPKVDGILRSIGMDYIYVMWRN